MDSIEYASDDVVDLKVEIPSVFASEESVHPEHGLTAGYTTYGSANRDRMARTVIGGDESLSDGDTVSDAAEFIDSTKTRFGDRYVLLNGIARGGMGVVHRARDLILKRDVALKTIKSGELAGADEIRRFEVEAEAAAQLKHPNIVSIYEIGEHDGQHYFTMELIDGRSLSALIQEKAVSPSLTAKYVRQIARGIHYAHRRGILHRDLKPSNVLIDGKHRIHVTDFGLAKRIETDSSLTATGQILGTPAYMPPEQASGQHDEVTIRSDVYSLGAILYELLTRRPPFEGESAIDVLVKVINETPRNPRMLNPDVPLDLETICLKCLEKERSRRYETAQDVADDLRSFLRGEPVVARPLGPVERSWRWMRRRPAIAFLGFTTLIASLTAIGSGAYLLADANQARDEA
ncbi:MAG: protein kinase [Fuerstiella sp.]